MTASAITNSRDGALCILVLLAGILNFFLAI
jgi:hypothetical protein